MATSAHFLGEAESSPETRAMFDGDLADPGFVMNLTRLWAHRPELDEVIGAAIGAAARAAGINYRQRGVLVTATAAALGDSYCSLAWGWRLAGASDEATAAAVVAGEDTGLDEVERVLARWARRVAADPNTTSAEDVAALRAAGFSDGQVLALTVFVALRVAFSTVNDALGARPDAAYRELVPPRVQAAVTFGRPFEGGPVQPSR